MSGKLKSVSADVFMLWRLLGGGFWVEVFGWRFYGDVGMWMWMGMSRRVCGVEGFCGLWVDGGVGRSEGESKGVER